ncbi:hypothetical protein [Clostridium estertheticum]|uniref:hypothetical protein n=1 Tax=Clostridium estertheticum TaxID=238834 RepID=UPI00129C50B2|nr:hypothetical protein [Clostridium estertheticum]
MNEIIIILTIQDKNNKFDVINTIATFDIKYVILLDILDKKNSMYPLSQSLVNISPIK